MQPIVPPEKKPWTEHIMIKVILIGMIILALMIPSLMILSLVQERSYRKSQVAEEVSSKWGRMQTIAGPYLAVPYVEELKKPDQPSEWSEHLLYYFPDDLVITGSLEPKIRKRSIFEVVLYESKIRLSGKFSSPDLGLLQIDPRYLNWEKATFHLGITDLSGISTKANVQIGSETIPMTSSAPVAIQFPAGLMSRLPAIAVDSGNFEFEVMLNLKGSEGIYFSPVADHNHIQLSSPWPSPKFEGQFLPDTSTVSPDGFEASWTVLDINRQLSKEWTDQTPQALAPAAISRNRPYMETGMIKGLNSVLGVELLDPVDHYTKTERTVKYAFLLITLTFVIYFFFEALKKQKVHALHYLLIGAALVIFFILLLSLSEQIGFDPAYAVASLATIGLISLYSRSIFSDKRNSVWVGGLLALQFAFIYIILQLEDYALLAGSIALFLILALIMYLTRNIKW